MSRHPFCAEPTREVLPSLRESLLSHASNCTVTATAAPNVFALTVLTVMRQALTNDRGYTSNRSAGTAASGLCAFGDGEQLAHPRSYGRPRKSPGTPKGATKHTGARLALRILCVQVAQHAASRRSTLRQEAQGKDVDTNVHSRVAERT